MDTATSLRNVVGFTDPLGRTSCVTDEREHYRLRCVALLKVSSEAQKESEEKHAAAMKIRRSMPRVARAARAAGARLGSNSTELLSSQSAELISQADAAKKKFRRTENALCMVLPFLDLALPTLAEAMLQKLPREIRDMIYENILVLDKDLVLYCENYTNNHPHDVNCFPRFFKDSYNRYDGYIPLWIDADMNDHSFATEVIQTVYRMAKFDVAKPCCLDKFLSNNLWNQFKNPVVPRDFISNIKIEIHLEPGEISDYALEIPKILKNLSTLHQIFNPGVTITLSLHLVDHKFDPKQGRAQQEQINSYLASLPVSVTHSDLLWRLSDWFCGQSVLKEFLGYLMPFAQKLWEKDQLLVIEGYYKEWEYKTNKEMRNFDAVLTTRNETLKREFEEDAYRVARGEPYHTL